MEDVTIGQIVAVIGTLTALASFFFGIYKFLKKVVLDKIEANKQEIEKLKEDMKLVKEDIEDSKEERLILLKGQLACLKGLKELKCDGPVTQGIKDIEEYMMRKSHD
jgi:hypothetical protein